MNNTEALGKILIFPSEPKVSTLTRDTRKTTSIHVDAHNVIDMLARLEGVAAGVIATEVFRLGLPHHSAYKRIARRVSILAEHKAKIRRFEFDGNDPDAPGAA